MIDYPHQIIINGSSVALESLLQGVWIPNDTEEAHLLSFCQEWFSDQQVFEQKTSGSTGTPKTIRIDREKMMHSAQKTNEFLSIHPDDTSLVCLSANYIAGKMMLVRAFINHQPIIFNTPSSNPLLALEHPVDFVALVPYQLKTIMKDESSLAKLNQIKNIIVGGAAIDVYLEYLIRKQINTHIHHTFGMTETISHFAMRNLHSIHRAYNVLDGVSIDTLEDGRLTVSSAITDHEVMVTNDIVKLLSPTSFEWVGRADNVINSGGIKIQIEDLERKIGHLFQEQGIQHRFFVFASTDSNFGESVHLALEGTHDDLSCLKQLPSTLQPKKVHQIERFSETPSQKVDRKATIYRLT